MTRFYWHEKINCWYFEKNGWARCSVGTLKRIDGLELNFFGTFRKRDGLEIKIAND
jgi:hypothetical protein